MVKINIDSKVENVLLKRTEIIFTYLHSKQGTPTRISIRDAIAAQTGASGETVYIVNLTTNTGSNETKGRAHVYQVEAEAQKIEPKYIQLRNYPKTKAPTTEKIPEEPKKDVKPATEKAPKQPKGD